jgi:hypothetical protein
MGKKSKEKGNLGLRLLMVALMLLAVCPAAWAQETTGNTKMEIYGFIMLDMGYNAGAQNPDWFDVMRPTKLPAYEGQYGEEGNFFAGVRQTRIGFKTSTPTDLGDMTTKFEWELFGVGVDAGQTTIRLRHAYGELGQFGAGQTWSPFMDIDVWPNSIEYWGPTGMVFYRNVQVRWMPMQGDTSVTLALERPGAGGETGNYSDIWEVQNLKGRYPLPDFSANWRKNGDWGHLQVSAILREIYWDDTIDDEYDLSDSALGWGLHVSGNYNIGKDIIHASVVYGEGIQNYMNDAGSDVALKSNSDPTRPVVGVALPVLGALAFYDHTWNDKWTSTIGYSFVDIDNSNGQSPDAFKHGDYALANMLYHPTPKILLGPELQWAKRENYSDGWSYDELRVQFSVKYDFSAIIGGK